MNIKEKLNGITATQKFLSGKIENFGERFGDFENFKFFYAYFTTKNIPLPMPDERPGKEKDFLLEMTIVPVLDLLPHTADKNFQFTHNTKSNTIDLIALKDNPEVSMPLYDENVDNDYYFFLIYGIVRNPYIRTKVWEFKIELQKSQITKFQVDLEIFPQIFTPKNFASSPSKNFYFQVSDELSNPRVHRFLGFLRLLTLNDSKDFDRAQLLN